MSHSHSSPSNRPLKLLATNVTRTTNNLQNLQFADNSLLLADVNPAESWVLFSTSYHCCCLIKENTEQVVHNAVKKEFDVGHNIARVWSRLVSTPLAPVGKLWFEFNKCGTPPIPHLGWGHNHRNLNPCECTVSTGRNAGSPTHPDWARVVMSSQSSITLGSL